MAGRVNKKAGVTWWNHLKWHRNTTRVMKSGYDYLASQPGLLGRYLGEWIAVVGRDIVAHGPDLKKVYHTATQAHPKETPLLVKIPKEQITLL